MQGFSKDVRVNLYLDVDGVLNIYSPSYNTYNVKWNKDFPNFGRMEPHLVRRLEWLCYNINLQNIFLVSGWDYKEAFLELERLQFPYADKLIKLPITQTGLEARGQDIIWHMRSKIRDKEADAAILLDDARYKCFAYMAQLDSGVFHAISNPAIGLSDDNVEWIRERISFVKQYRLK